MLLDAWDHDVRLNREAQVVIVGAGPAGLTLAQELGEVADVLLIESGGFEANAEIDALNAGKTIGLPYRLEETRTRRIGGSLSLWAGWITPFDAHDFAPHAQVSCGGWPFGFNTLEPYFTKSAHRLNLWDLCFDARALAEGCGVPLPLDSDIVRPTVWRFGTPTWRFDEADRVRLTSSHGLTLLTHAHVVDLRLGRGHDRIQDVTIRTLDGREGTVSADLVVFACGGLEAARLLLNANRQIPTGVANSSGLVGRCFMEHPHLTFESLQLQRPDLFVGSIEPQRDELGREFMLNFGLTPEIQWATGILNGRVHVFRTPTMSPDDMPRVGVFMEQAPNPASRLTLGDKRDRLGLLKLVLDWQLCELDWSTYRKTQQLFIDAFEQIGAGCRVATPGDAHSRVDVLYSNHHLGTTRMATRRDDGVVDPNCRAHDVDNLYMIGGNVFPTASWANPTFTVIAMTYRLTDHLKARLQGEPAPQQTRLPEPEPTGKQDSPRPGCDRPGGLASSGLE
jgi:choline dehydrogenase-like flavoprotein